MSAFISAKYEKIEALHPDLVLAFSDLQADIARDLAKRGLNVIVFNQRSVAEVLQMILTLAQIVGVEAMGIALVEKFQSNLTAIAASAQRLPRRPRVLFEEWDDPLISGIRWVEELIEIAGGEPIFPELRDKAVAPDRVIRPDEVLPRNPEIILGSWCGKKVRKDFIRSRTGWSEMPAVRNDNIYEIKSTYILQPGPAAVTEEFVSYMQLSPRLSGSYRSGIAAGRAHRSGPQTVCPLAHDVATHKTYSLPGTGGVAAHQENAAKQPLKAQTGWSVWLGPPRPCLSKGCSQYFVRRQATPPVPGRDYASRTAIMRDLESAIRRPLPLTMFLATYRSHILRQQCASRP